jgi:DNA-binding beta-propeller fold protein YncE
VPSANASVGHTPVMAASRVTAQQRGPGVAEPVTKHHATAQPRRPAAAPERPRAQAPDSRQRRGAPGKVEGSASSRRRILTAAGTTLVVALAASLILYALLGGHQPGKVVRSGDLINVYSGSYLNGPEGIAVAGTTVWITNAGNNSVAELDARNGHVVNTFSGASHHFKASDLIAADRLHIWIPNGSTSSPNGTITELNASNGSVVSVHDEQRHGLDYPVAIADDGRHVWITSEANSLIELDASTGKWIQTIPLPGASAGGISVAGNDIWIEGGEMVVEVDADNGTRKLDQLLGDGSAIVDDGTHVWAADLGLGSSSSSIIEFNADNDQRIGAITSPNSALHSISAIAACNSHVWVANRYPSSSVIELNADTGKFINALSGAKYDLNQPLSMAVAGNDLWIADAGRFAGGSGNGSVTELAC